MRSYNVKENHIGSAVRRSFGTDRHTFILRIIIKFPDIIPVSFCLKLKFIWIEKFMEIF